MVQVHGNGYGLSSRVFVKRMYRIPIFIERAAADAYTVHRILYRFFLLAFQKIFDIHHLQKNFGQYGFIYDIIILIFLHCVFLLFLF